jgi:hypothetical protein
MSLRGGFPNSRARYRSLGSGLLHVERAGFADRLGHLGNFCDELCG